MKKISIAIYDADSDMIITDDNLKLPSITIDEQQVSGFDAALDILNSLGVECCMMGRVHFDEELEIWQPLKYGDKLEFDGHDKNLQWTAVNFVDCDSDGRWAKNVMKRKPKDESRNAFLKEG